MNGLLFIDDEEGVRRSVVRALKNEPYELFTSADGEEGIEFIKKNLSLLSTVISDYRMPGLNGLDTLAAVGMINPEVTRIILTGYATMEAAILATNEGIDGFLTKPFDNIELRAKIREINVRKRLRQFVSQQIYREIENSTGYLKPTFHEVSILFSDIRGFTNMSQNISPDTLAEFLNNYYFSPLGEIAYNFNGTVDKHIGDSIMVAYGSPVLFPDDADRAVKSAIEMQEKARQIDDMLGGRNGLRLRIGIGIATGKVFSGVLGSLRKKEYSSVGMAVNMAARLQSRAKEREILISESTFARLSKDIEAEALPPVNVKGISKPVNIYKVRYP
ncbi:MAG: adenylate/guanylate cyclase domain-containing response regulator [Desulfobacteraceae bacterium]|nr:MAG: adenylate/guanylate cyclase domain-containing response regulator [Desulfobacteraceae bacterium]